LKQGAPAGRYPLVLEAGEVVDFETARASRPTLISGELVIGSDVTAVASCKGGPVGPPPPPEQVNAAYKLGSVLGAPGSTVAMPFFVRADTPIQAYAFSVDFDEEVLEAVSGEYAWRKPDGSDYGFSILEINNDDRTPGNGGTDEGFVIGAAVFDMQKPVTMPAGEDHLAVRLRFKVHPDASVSTTEVRFLDGGQGSGQPVRNTITSNSYMYTPETAASFVFLDGRITVIPDIATFVRGDSTGDGVLDLSDSLATLSYLFQGGSPPVCLDAADFNDDGRLDVADPIGGLWFLFQEGAAPAAPYPEPGLDPTPDDLHCGGGH
jgi:hypothetical protein